MSLTVSNDLLDQARTGEVDDAAFVTCVRDSLPYAWSLISDLVEQREHTGAEFADNTVPPPDEAARGQLLRALASDAMRGALERHFGVRLAFQNCHRVAVFDPAAAGAHAEFITARSQILNQTPELVDC
ncbi:SCO5389 family protein [Streptosporangium amethystogenes]|uniref:SCO5389 family protein n=1 Tax=Streptosporangium amethystogenes TaxID=2002 RepID=UPI0004CBBFC3|nr:SCO5389 family protein [Streptosporangium amethystogenes]